MHTGEAKGPQTASPRAVRAGKAARQGAGGFLRAETLNAFLDRMTIPALPHPRGNPKDCTNLKFREFIIKHQYAHREVGWRGHALSAPCNNSATADGFTLPIP